MSKKAPNPPAAPNPRAEIAAQAKATPDVISPFGNVIYSGSPTKGTYKQTVTLSPEEEALYKGRNEIAQSLLGRSGEAIGALPVGYSFKGAEDPTTNRFFMNQKKLLDDVFADDERRLDQKLANQGLPMGGEAFDAEMENFRRSKADAYEGAAADALDTGLRHDLTQRQQNYNEIAAALGGAQLQPVGTAQGPDVGNAFTNYQAGLNRQYQGDLARFQGDVGMTNAGIGGTAAIAAAFI